MNKAFTLIETLVVIMVTVILAAIMIVYSHNGEKQIVLFRDQAKVVGILNRAKFLSLQMFSVTDANKPCAYGVHFDNNTTKFLIFKDLDSNPSMSGCQGNNIYDPSNEFFEEFDLDSRLKFQTSLPGIDFNVVFIPPNPSVIMTSGASDVTITITDQLTPPNKKIIKINNFGQITAQ